LPTKQKSRLVAAILVPGVKDTQSVFASVRMHFAHRVCWTLRPLSSTVTFCRFARNLRLVARWEKERLWPKVVVFPQLEHFAIFWNPFLQ
jgi:hypothetical protein